MARLADYLGRIPSFRPHRIPASLPQLPDGAVVYYPGAGHDRKLCDLLQGKECTIIHQDPVYERRPFPHEDLVERVITIDSRVSGDEGIEADLVYLSGMGKHLIVDETFIPNVLRNAKQGAYLCGKNCDLALMGLVTEGLTFLGETSGVIEGNQQQTDFCRYLWEYPQTISAILKASLDHSYTADELPGLTSRGYVEMINQGKSRDTPIGEQVSRFREITRREIEGATPEFYDFLGCLMPAFVREWMGNTYWHGVDDVCSS